MSAKQPSLPAGRPVWVRLFSGLAGILVFCLPLGFSLPSPPKLLFTLSGCALAVYAACPDGFPCRKSC